MVILQPSLATLTYNITDPGINDPTQHHHRSTHLLSNSTPSARPRSRLWVPSTSTSTNGVARDAAGAAARRTVFADTTLPSVAVVPEEQASSSASPLPPCSSRGAAATADSAFLFLCLVAEVAGARAVLLRPLLRLFPEFAADVVAVVVMAAVASGDLFLVFRRRGREQSCRSTHAPTVVRLGSASSACSRTGNLSATKNVQETLRNKKRRPRTTAEP